MSYLSNKRYNIYKQNIERKNNESSDNTSDVHTDYDIHTNYDYPKIRYIKDGFYHSCHGYGECVLKYPSNGSKIEYMKRNGLRHLAMDDKHDTYCNGDHSRIFGSKCKNNSCDSSYDNNDNDNDNDNDTWCFSDSDSESDSHNCVDLIKPNKPNKSNKPSKPDTCTDTNTCHKSKTDTHTDTNTCHKSKTDTHTDTCTDINTDIDTDVDTDTDSDTESDDKPVCGVKIIW